MRAASVAKSRPQPRPGACRPPPPLFSDDWPAAKRLGIMTIICDCAGVAINPSQIRGRHEHLAIPTGPQQPRPPSTGQPQQRSPYKRQYTRRQQKKLPAPGPFLKWAGGKRRLLPVISSSFPPNFGRYFEPFLGGGAVLFHVLSAYPGKQCSVSDANPDLIAAYETIRDDVEGLIALLSRHAEEYARGGKDYYYEVRAASPGGKAERAARLLFLNRTCFNGLYRVNRKGEFNVPFGWYKNPSIVNADMLRAAGSLLSSRPLSIKCGDFGGIVGEASRGDLIYMDPPYQPVSTTASFTSYTMNDFGSVDLERLASVCAELDSRGCYMLFSNSDVPEMRRLFGGGRWMAARLSVSRMINSDGTKRTGHSELLLKNF